MNVVTSMRLEEYMCSMSKGIPDACNCSNEICTWSKMSFLSQSFRSLETFRHRVLFGIGHTHYKYFVVVGVVHIHLNWLTLGWTFNKFSSNLVWETSVRFKHLLKVCNRLFHDDLQTSETWTIIDLYEHQGVVSLGTNLTSPTCYCNVLIY